jgi:hypothetical protein
MGTEFGQPWRIDKDVAHDLEASGLATRDRGDVCYEDSRRVRGEDVDALVWGRNDEGIKLIFGLGIYGT